MLLVDDKKFSLIKVDKLRVPMHMQNTDKKTLAQTTLRQKSFPAS